MSRFFYSFLRPFSNELAQIAKELEGTIYTSPRSMLTHSRIFIEATLEKVMIHEKINFEPHMPIIDRIKVLDEAGILTDEVREALHTVRMLGNQASHNPRSFRFSESLTAWENIHTIVKWFVEVYWSHSFDVPPYLDPVMDTETNYDLEEINLRFNKIEEMIKHTLEQERSHDEEAREGEKEDIIQQQQLLQEVNEKPGYTTIRTITYGDDSVHVPYFLRDAFLLPQRFEQSKTFLIRLGGVEEARIMSELPNNLEGIHLKVKRYNESHSEQLFKELKLFIKEEIRRKNLLKERPGELFLFYDGREVLVTEQLGEIIINKENFPGSPGFIKQLNDDGIYKISDLPKELVIIGKYQNVGKKRLTDFFAQIMEKQKG